MATHSPKPRRSGVVIPTQARRRGRLAARSIWLLASFLGATVRFRLNDQSGFFERHAQSPEPVIFCLWHNRLALCLPLYRHYVRKRQPERRLAAMVSASRDGGLLARVLELFEVQPVRGSSSRRGPQALLEMTSWAERGYDLAVTPDGPRGPRYVVQDGVVALGQLTGRNIVPVSYHLGSKVCVKSWDRFQIPLPLTRCTVAVGQPVRIPEKATEAEREDLRQLLEARMKALTDD